MFKEKVNLAILCLQLKLTYLEWAFNSNALKL